MEPTQFGRYQLLKLLGKGGMGEVWRAYDTATNNRTVAIKLLPPHLAQDDTFVQRFRREADAAARLNNPHIIPIHTYGEIDGRLYVDMRLIEGRDLQQVLADGPIDPARAVRIIEGVAKALHAAHEVGLLHRDVKPSNILLDRDDFAYLIDFGIARAVDETRLTKSGNTIGTFQYIAPERLGTRAEEDARADIYSLACVLYECLTGSPPFASDTMAGLVAAHLNTPPPQPSTTQPEVPEPFDKVIATGMAKDPDQRFATTVELASAAHDAITTPIPRPAQNLRTPPASVTNPAPPTPATEPAAQQQPADLNMAATQQRPPGRPPVPQPRPADRPPAQFGTPPPPGGRRPRRRLTWPLIAAVVVILAAAGVTGYLVWPHPAQTQTGQPAAPSSTTKSSSTSSATTKTMTSTSAQASGRNQTIADYIKQNGIQETMISHNTPGAPTINLPVPDGWKVVPESTDAPYGGIAFNTPTDPNDPPKIIAIVEKLTGNVDTDKLLAVAPGEVKNLQGYDGGDGNKSTLSGFPAYQLGGDYTKDGTQRVVAQKTVVIQGKDGLYVLQLNAEGPQPDKTPLMDATTVIDDKTTITP